MAIYRLAPGTDLHSKIHADPDIKDTYAFAAFSKRERNNSHTGLAVPNVDEGSQQFAASQVRRPGFKLKIVANSEKLRNTPSEKKNEFEVEPADTIPFSTYRRMSYDPVIQFNTLLLKGWIAGLKFSVDSTDPQIKAVVQHVLETCYSDLVRDMLGALAYGFAFGEKVWQREKLLLEKPGEDGGQETVFSGDIFSLAKIKFINPDADIRYYKNKQDDISKITQQQGSSNVPVPRAKLVWFALDREFSGVFGRSRFKAVYDEWFYYQINKQQMLRHVQRTGSPPLKGRYPDGTSSMSAGDQDYFGSAVEEIDNVDIAEYLAESYLSQGTILLPSERDEKTGEYLWDLEFDKVDNADTSPFISVLELLAKRMSEGIGVPSSLGQGDSNLAEATAQSELLIVIVEDLVEQLEQAIRVDIVEQIVAYNFGPEAIQNVEFKIDKTGLGRFKHLKDVYNNALRLAMSKTDVLPAAFPDLFELGRELGIKQKPFSAQFTVASTTTDGENPEKVKRQDEDSNQQDRATKPARDKKRPSPKDDKSNTGG